MKQALIAFTVVFTTMIWALEKGPEDLIGQKANYKLDKNPKRTTSMLKDGTFLATITHYHPNAEGGPAMEVALDYKFNVAMVGEQKGVENALLDQAYFTPEFLEKLRKEGKYESENFKAIHKGYEDVKTLEGKIYAHTDIIFLYDIRDSKNMTLHSDLASFLAAIVRAETKADIEDMKVLMHVYPGVPVLSAVQIDVSGKYEGMSVKAGADYQSH
ncbi:MAG: hypothetical protein EB078_00730 [Proteobacteria bacterium]|nr:hypothetical protein [Pseudomonadota bacterium]NDC24632.1 hypothetical protein [Pseudomonadota bacterium]NDD03403.1 hypothetical protein [Pseudomonadota bacterium]NDG26982.1 hypothetical protein [Pseudomonadota bacterium]